MKNPVGFRGRLGACGGLISGGFALGFFERMGWGEGDMDVYVNGSFGGSEVGSGDGDGDEGKGLRDPDNLGMYLVEREGYELLSVKTEENGGLLELTREKLLKQVSGLSVNIPYRFL